MAKRVKLLVIPDTQVRPGVNTDHLAALGNYIAEKRPDHIVHLGDHFDLPSLSTYNLEGQREGQRYAEDVQAGKDAMFRLTAPFLAVRNYRPKMHFLMGNHEDRIRRTAETNPTLKGFMSNDDLNIAAYGWKVHDFNQVIKIGGIEFSHYFISGVMGRPVSSAAALLRERQGSAVMGHVQQFQFAVHPRTQRFAMFAGVFYTHQENYLGPQGNTCRPMVHMLHEVRDGIADPMAVSADYLLRQYL